MGSDTRVNGITGRDFDVFIGRYHQDLASLAYLITGDHAVADDVTAEAFVATWSNWERVCQGDHPLAYVRRMVIRIADRRTPREAVSGRVLDAPSALRSLPPRRRAVTVLRYAFDLSETDIADTLQLRVGRVRREVGRGAAQLSALLQSVGDPAAAPDRTGVRRVRS